MTKYNRLSKPFKITYVTRADLEALGFNTTRVDEYMMKGLSWKLSRDYRDQLFWGSLAIIAEGMGIPIRKKHLKP